MDHVDLHVYAPDEPADRTAAGQDGEVMVRHRIRYALAELVESESEQCRPWDAGMKVVSLSTPSSEISRNGCYAMRQQLHFMSTLVRQQINTPAHITLVLLNIFCKPSLRRLNWKIQKSLEGL